MTEYVNKTALSEALDCAPKTLDLWIRRDKSFPHPKTQGSKGNSYVYDLEECLEWKVKHDLSVKSPPPDRVSANARKNAAQAELFELKIAEVKSELLSRVDVEDVLSDVLLRLSKFLDAIPDRMRTELGVSDALAARVDVWLENERTTLVNALKQFTNH